MPSNIDPTKPAQGVPASKADLRANLRAAKTELDHGGFLEGLVPTAYTPADSQTKSHLQALDAEVFILREILPGLITSNTGTALTIQATVFGFYPLRTVLCTENNPITVTLHNDTPAGKTVELVRKGTGNITVVAGTGATLVPAAGTGNWPAALHSTTDLNEALVYKVDTNATGTNAAWRLVARP